jgi:hypothetical protein
MSQIHAFALLVLAVLASTGCEHEKKAYRDIETLPHVERTRGTVSGLRDFPWAYEYQLGDARICYDRALQRDPTQRGTVSLIALPPGGQAFAKITTQHTGTVSAGLESCIASALRALQVGEPKSKETATLTLEPRTVREPTPPGDFAFRKVIDHMVEPAKARVVSLEVHRNPDQATQREGERSLEATCKAKVEFLKDSEEDWCGELRPLGGPQCRPGAHEPGDCECPKVKHDKGAQIMLDGRLSFTLYGKNGWVFSMGMYEDGRRFFGDETREIE